MKWVRALVAIVAMITIPAAAEAKWHKASTQHFVVYADDSPADIQRFAEQLERYHAAMDFLSAGDYPTPSPSNRVTIYVVKSDVEVRRLAGEDASRWLGGFYIPRAGGSLAIIPKVDAARGELDQSMLTLLHEYAHHFIIGNVPIALPRWLTEGSAEFFASAKFEKDGGISLGRPAYHRAGELYYAKDVKARDLLDEESYKTANKGKSYDAFYGKSWLLYHYLRFDKKRDGQFNKYLGEIIRGTPWVDAAKNAFGDFDVLEKELDSYLTRKMTYYSLTADKVPTGPVIVSALGAGEAAVMSVVIRSKRGVNETTAPKILADARAIASQFPNDPYVFSALAEAEYDAGNDKEAIAAADKAIAADPKQVNAYVQKGYALFRIAENADDQAAAYAEARKPFIALNRLENDHPIPLIYFYRSYVQQGVAPTPLAIFGLEQAVGLAPFDKALRFNLARQYIRDGRHQGAKAHLSLIAYDPHGGGMAKTALQLIEKIDSGKLLKEDAEAPQETDEG